MELLNQLFDTAIGAEAGLDTEALQRCHLGAGIRGVAMAQVEAKHIRLPWPATLSIWLR